jgi:hypothetical protein
VAFNGGERESLSTGWCETECGRKPLGKKRGRYKYPFTSIPMVQLKCGSSALECETLANRHRTLVQARTE